MSKRYFELHSRMDDDIAPSTAAYAHIKAERLCKSCDFLKPIAKPVNIEAATVPTNTPLGYVHRIIIPFLSRELIELLDLPKLRHRLILGAINDRSGQRTAYRSVWSVHPLLIRGNAHALHHVCRACRRLLYTRVKGSHITEDAVSTQDDIFCADTGIVVVEESLKNRILERFSKSIRAYLLPVEKTSRDGLRPDLSVWLKPEQLEGYVEKRPKFV